MTHLRKRQPPTIWQELADWWPIIRYFIFMLISWGIFLAVTFCELT